MIKKLLILLSIVSISIVYMEKQTSNHLRGEIVKLEQQIYDLQYVKPVKLERPWRVFCYSNGERYGVIMKHQFTITFADRGKGSLVGDRCIFDRWLGETQ